MPPKNTSKKPKNRLKLLEKEFFLHGVAGREETFLYEMPDAELQVWPHTAPSAKLMANCGFFYVPTKKLTDRVSCVGCRRLQQSWDRVNDPSKHHLEKHPDCPFSLVHYYATLRELGEVDWKNVDILKDPLSSQAVAVRAATFGDFWPFDKIKGAKPTSGKMIEAGFCSFPQNEDDDLASCLYCGTCLEGWELEDDPMVEHRKRAAGKGCYFLDMLEQARGHKRLSEEVVAVPKSKKTRFSFEAVLPAEVNNTKKTKASKNKSVEELETVRKMEEPAVIARPRRAAREASKKILDLSDEDDDSDVELLDDDTFGLTSNELQLDSDPEPYRSSQRTHKSDKSANTSKAQKRTSASPLKKSKILDSSFDGEDDLFSKKKLEKVNIEVLPDSESLGKKKTSEKQPKPSPLHDITNISDASAVISPKKRTRPVVLQADESEDDEEEEIILVSNSSSVGQKERDTEPLAEKISKSSDHNSEKVISSSSTLKPTIVEEVIQDPETTHHDDIAKDASMSELEPSPLASKTQLSPSMKSEHSGSLSRLKGNKSNKSLLAQTRFFDSPKLKRSQSPFLDSQYRGTDQIESISDIGPDDNPIEESTDHNIDLSLSDLDKQLAKTEKHEDNGPTEAEADRSNDDLAETSEKNEAPVDEGTLDCAPTLQQSGNYTADDTYHSAGEVTPSDYWLSTDTNKVFHHLDDLETARAFLTDLNRLDYELHDDVDGRITTFINQMPDEELEMTIEQWILHMAKQGKSHLQQVCTQMVDDFDEECERALEKLRSLPTI